MKQSNATRSSMGQHTVADSLHGASDIHVAYIYRPGRA